MSHNNSKKQKQKSLKVYRLELIFRLKWPEMAGMTRNIPKFDPRWNGGLSRTGLHTGTRFSVHSSRNGMEYTTMCLTPNFGKVDFRI